MSIWKILRKIFSVGLIRSNSESSEQFGKKKYDNWINPENFVAFLSRKCDIIVSYKVSARIKRQG